MYVKHSLRQLIYQIFKLFNHISLATLVTAVTIHVTNTITAVINGAINEAQPSSPVRECVKNNEIRRGAQAQKEKHLKSIQCSIHKQETNDILTELTV